MIMNKANNTMPDIESKDCSLKDFIQLETQAYASIGIDLKFKDEKESTIISSYFKSEKLGECTVPDTYQGQCNSYTTLRLLLEDILVHGLVVLIHENSYLKEEAQKIKDTLTSDNLFMQLSFTVAENIILESQGVYIKPALLYSMVKRASSSARKQATHSRLEIQQSSIIDKYRKSK